MACRQSTDIDYYCDMCDPVKRGNVQLLANAQSSICDAKGGDTVVVSATICPPPQASMTNYCDHFSKGLGDPYWQKKGNLDVTFEVFNRKTDADYAAAKADRAKYSSLVSQFKKDAVLLFLAALVNPKYLLSFSPPDSEVSNWYKYSQSEKVGCRQSLVNYNLGGSKANTGLLFEAATASGALSKNPCPAPTSSG
uniref:Uncharacterized protein n=1 Tax=Romanomermis culicivorax TaxID=13658 RepID=A0A915J7U4_ROMCU